MSSSSPRSSRPSSRAVRATSRSPTSSTSTTSTRSSTSPRTTWPPRARRRACLRPAAPGHGRDEEGRHRHLRHARQAAPRGHPSRRASARPRDDVLRRRGTRPRTELRTCPARTSSRSRATPGQAAHRLDVRPNGTRSLPRHLPRAGRGLIEPEAPGEDRHRGTDRPPTRSSTSWRRCGRASSRGKESRTRDRRRGPTRRRRGQAPGQRPTGRPPDAGPTEATVTTTAPTYRAEGQADRPVGPTTRTKTAKAGHTPRAAVKSGRGQLDRPRRGPKPREISGRPASRAPRPPRRTGPKPGPRRPAASKSTRQRKAS